MEQDEPFIKIIVVGEQGVGKTCMLNQYCYNRFDNNTAPTIGCDFTTKVTHFKEKTVKLQLWDIAGQERYNSVSKLYVRGAMGCIIVCDINDERSLQETLKWAQIVEENCDVIDGKKIPMILLQNKADQIKNLGRLESFQTVEYLEKFAQEHSFNAAFQTSAKEGTNLAEAFQKMLETILSQGRVRAAKETGNFAQKNKPVQLTNKTQQNSQTNSSQNPKRQGGGCC